ncbi:hypothetical protein K440DRAFT_594812 [Wilcoxina mikolae CBS 423.85]|nr:hypothetical protein K440DRAFT_594812 [Wilcoxina mikolae CBS 423.85]
MKAHARFSVLVFLLLIFCLCWTSLRISYRKAIGLLPRRIVIFGDESSAIPSAGELQRRENKQTVIPSTWTSNLCHSLHVSCDSFAPLKPSQGFVGAVVDNIVFNTTSPDLRDQVDRWIEFETKARKKGFGPERSSLFVLFFGTNDVWEFSSLDRQNGISAVEASLDSMFDQLGRVARHWADPLQVLVPTAIDVTLLPAWEKYRLGNDTSGQELRNAVFLRKKWNEELEKRAERWKGGTVMLWDAGQWFVDTLRSGKKGGWQDVRSACLKENGEKCDHPEKYLMWDNLHLGARAHKIMAKEVVGYLM